MENRIRVAIDGPSGAGKSTIAKAVAKKLGIDYIDTGAMYRAVGYKVLKQGVDPGDAQALKTLLDETEIDFSKGNIILDGNVINDKIRTPEISKKASECSALAQVREKLVQLQRGMGQSKSVIMDGRDIGSNVLTDAEYKFFMTASPEERARRRFDELKEKGQQVTYEQVLEDILQRDHNDMTRELNPLRKAEDARELDTTGMSIEEVTDYILKEIEKNGNC
ncbi:(d)CMP kinase [bacterium 210820-DFI.6.37]|nr:(d)CMP kinase [bacterium 210820-DFI.6.37]